MGVFFVAVFLCLARLYGASSLNCICTMDYTPVCGADGKTYGNKCALDCDGVQMAHQGECKPIVANTLVVSPCLCPKNYQPVCGQDGRTHANQCEMNCAGVAFFQDGACIASSGGIIKRAITPCICPFMYMPVCGSDGITYGNECNLKCAATNAINAGTTPIFKRGDGRCPTTTRSIPTTTATTTTPKP